MDKGEGEKTKKKRTFSVLGKMLAISGSSGVVGQGTGKVHLILYVGDLLGKKNNCLINYRYTFFFLIEVLQIHHTIVLSPFIINVIVNYTFFSICYT